MSARVESGHNRRRRDAPGKTQALQAEGADLCGLFSDGYQTAMFSIGTPEREVRRDLICLALITGLSALPYVANLGFYSDDWGLFSHYHFHGFSDLFSTFAGRPVQAIYSVLLFSLFGMNPLGYHIVNTVVIGAAAMLLYALLIRLGFDRRLGFGVCVFFLLLPQLSTIRVWIAAAQIPLSMVLALASLHAQLTFARTNKVLAAVIAAVAAVFSIAAYEIFAPLIASLALKLLWDRRHERRAIFLMAGIAALLTFAVVYKIILASDRAGAILDGKRYLQGLLRLVSPTYDWRLDSSLNLFAAAEVHFWLVLKVWLQALIGWIADPRLNLTVSIALGIALLSFWRCSTAGAGRILALRLLLVGFVVFVLGHATFLVVPSIMFAPTGLANRVLVAAAVGVAMVMVAALGLSSKIHPRIFPLVIAFVAFSAVLRLSQVEGYWSEAPAIQRQILAQAKLDLSSVPSGSTVMLDGVCPYHGPAVVFETSWDVAGALSLALGRELMGDAVSPRMSVTSLGLRTSMYEQEAFYPYGTGLYAYNPHLRVVAPLTNAHQAQAYFRRPGRWPTPCPRAYVGHGVLI